MRQQHSRERITTGVAEKAREAIEFLALLRQRVGLLVGHHLQAMLDHAQKR